MSRITHHTNLQHSSGLIIPLGVIAELTFGSWRALGLIARSPLSDDELSAIAGVLRDRLRDPFAFLAQQFDWALAETEAGEGLSGLSQRFTDSMFFAPPQGHKVRRVLPQGATMAGSSILADLRKERDDEFYLMLAETTTVGELLSSDDRARLLSRRAA